ncbi:MAG: hypothetical protein Q8R15_03800 [Candidatus Micrarchaeota archaeon]|nr:hypothetical protein [Candidatus Micrarchaeota archaeon]
MRILRTQMRKLPFLSGVKGTSVGCAANFRAANRPIERGLRSVAKLHGFSLSPSLDEGHFYLEPKPRQKNFWGILLSREKGRINSVRVITAEDFTVGRRQRVLKFLAELAQKPN